ncbi:MAG TPA: amidohydrolase [Dehalococcoidia bacterium]|nr:amidohydrolase [Dehalococcoidia bacterium]
MRVVNGRIYTQDRAGTVAEAFAVENGRFAAVGATAALPARGDELDLHGRTVLPGLIDAHAHLRNLAESRLNVDLSGAASAVEAAARVALRAAERPAGTWITGRGWDQNAWTDPAFPTSAPLDAAALRNPVALTRVDGHALWVNSAALHAAGIDDAAPDPPGGRILRNVAGHATGVLIDQAMGLVRDLVPPVGDDDLDAAVEAAVAECLRFGLTGVHEMGVDERTIASYTRLIDTGRFPFRVLGAINGPGRTWQAWRERGPMRRHRDRLSVSAIKLYADGALGSRGAALLAPYSDDPDNSGLELASGADLERWARDAVRHGFQVCIHAIGDRANRTVLDAYERVLAGDREKRLRVEHAQILAPAEIVRFRRLGVIPSMQQTHCTSDSAWADRRLGSRVAGAYAWRSLLDTGVIIAGGSDFPVESPNPLLGIAAGITRSRLGEPLRPWHPEQCMTREEAVRSFTRWAAYAGFDEDVAGSIEPGKYADFVVLDRDIYTCPPEQSAETRVLLTVFGGEIVWQSPGAW